ncbi:hypothetical protein K8R32_04910, partial [bacterium]|nr:hypothetical protein [bacterium]
YFNGDSDAKESLLRIVENDKLEGDDRSSGDSLRALAACYLFHDQGVELSDEEKEQLEIWKRNNPTQYAETEEIMANKQD